MEPFKRFAEDLGSIYGEDDRIWKAGEARRFVVEKGQEERQGAGYLGALSLTPFSMAERA